MKAKGRIHRSLQNVVVLVIKLPQNHAIDRMYLQKDTWIFKNATVIMIEVG